MANILDVVEGWTDELGPFTLKADGVAVDLTGMTIEPILKGSDGVQVTLAADQYRIDDTETTGKVYFTPASGDLVNAKTPYTLRWKVTDGAGDVVFFPNAKADQITVYKP